MFALYIIIAILVLIALLRFGIIAEYSADGLVATAKAGPLSIRVYPSEEKPEKAEKKALKKARKEKKAKKKPVEKKPGGLKSFRDMLPSIKKALSRLKRRMLVKKLTIRYIAAGEDAAKTAMSYGAANAVFGLVTHVLENNFRIKRSDLQAFVDFQAEEQSIYVKVYVSLAVWEAVYVTVAMIPVLLRPKKTSVVRKDV